jgi:hypothetical protein
VIGRQDDPAQPCVWTGEGPMFHKNGQNRIRFWFATGQILALGILLFSHGDARAQATSDKHPSTQATTSPVAEQDVRRTTRERFRDFSSQTFSPAAIVVPVAGAGISQWRNYPPEWKQGAEGYGKRLASAYGSAVVENAIGFGIATLDQEDLRYPRSDYEKSAILKRTGHAIAYTLVPNKEGGGRRFGFARLIGAYGGGFVTNTWYPSRRSDLHNALYLGTANLGSDLAVNLLKEFFRPHLIFGNTNK